ncbi:gas vesicle protein K [Streptomyces sp. NPDC005438]|uniref:gas vesicle protein K n=1 Tax=Streptomyces sp. NPDC005438 TaxID=3156880 RepID=UPI0033AAE67F
MSHPPPEEEPGPADRLEPDHRWDEVAQAAARAFALLPAPADESTSPRPPQRLNTDPDHVQQDLIRLVLTIVELLRQLMERTALHRVDQGDLSEEEEERVGLTLMTLQDRMADLCEQHGLTMADLNLDLGPLGSLLPPRD